MSRFSSFVVPAVAAVLGGAIGGLVVSFVKPSASRSEVPAAEREPAQETDDLERRLVALEQRLAIERLRPLRPLQPSAASTTGNPDNGSQTEGARSDSPPVVDDPVFEAAVRDILERVDEERESEREVRSEERRREAAQAWTQELATRAGLRDDQKAKVLAIVQEYLNGLREPQSNSPDAGAPMTRREWRAHTRALRDRAEQRIGEVLSREQFEAYKALDGDQRIGGIRRLLRPRNRD